VASEQRPDLGLFLDILHTLESIEAPYMIIGAFAATVYGITRVTYDIDIVVKLEEAHTGANCCLPTCHGRIIRPFQSQQRNAWQVPRSPVRGNEDGSRLL
jgi:hypothetical protein